METQGGGTGCGEEEMSMRDAHRVKDRRRGDRQDGVGSEEKGTQDGARVCSLSGWLDRGTTHRY